MLNRLLSSTHRQWACAIARDRRFEDRESFEPPVGSTYIVEQKILSGATTISRQGISSCIAPVPSRSLVSMSLNGRVCECVVDAVITQWCWLLPGRVVAR
jgi:hypothetical protein